MKKLSDCLFKKLFNRSDHFLHLKNVDPALMFVLIEAEMIKNSMSLFILAG